MDTRAPTGTTNTYFLEEASLLLDPAAPIDDLGIDPESVDHVAVTHAHHDHLAGLPAVMEATNATLWAKHGRENEMVEATGCYPEKTFRDGDTIGGDGAVRVLETPGHAPDHVTFRIDSSAIVGDLAMADSSVVVAAPEGDMRAYLTSLRRLLTR
ncbi:MAG: MBL fold metallo-hydrolase, partial [Halodesulfurarchaeum sp.]